MEFLMTYGWAILVVLVVIGALAYFGVLNPSILLPERCEMQSGFNCKDYLVKGASDELLMTIENGRGSDFKVVSINLTSEQLGGASCTSDYSANPIEIMNGRSQNFTMTCNPSIASYTGRNAKYKWDIVVKWFSTDSSATYTHTLQGQLLARVE